MMLPSCSLHGVALVEARRLGQRRGTCWLQRPDKMAFRQRDDPVAEKFGNTQWII